MFPPLNSFGRFCLHSLVKDHYQQLTSFSVGEDKERRTVVCHQAVVAEHALQNAHHTSLGLPKIQSESTSIVQNVENDLTVPSDDNEIKFEERGSSNLGKSKVHRRPDRAVYAPPGARRKPVGQNQMITADSVNMVDVCVLALVDCPSLEIPTHKRVAYLINKYKLIDLMVGLVSQ